MTQWEVRVGQEGAGHLRPTPLPVRAVKLSVAEVLANLGGVFLIWKRGLEDDLVLIKMTLRHPEIRTLEGKSREEEEDNVSSHDVNT